MVARDTVQPRTKALTAGIIALLLILLPLFCGCLQVEPEELPLEGSLKIPTTAISPTGPVDTTVVSITAPPAIAITSPKQTRHYTEQDFPPEVKSAISDFVGGRTTDTINGFLRWESVRARTDTTGKARIQEQVRLIDYAFFNTTLKENISVYIGITGEQAKRVRNESVFSDNGYAIGSSDPSVVYRKLAQSARGTDGYLSMCVLDFKPGDRILYVNTTEREFLIPHGGIWDVVREDSYKELVFTADSIPRYKDIVPTKVRLVYTREHP